MTLLDFLHQFDGEGSIMVGLIIILSLIEISPIQLNPWSWIAQLVARAIGITDLRSELTELRRDMDELDRKLNNLKADEESKRELRDALSARRRILRFNDELLQGIRHSVEMFNNVLEDITNYENYCRCHPEFVNQRAVMAEGNIKKVYQHCMDTHDFL